MPTRRWAMPAIKGRDMGSARQMLAWHARTMQRFWLTSNNLISAQSDSVDQGHIKPPKYLCNENYFHSCLLIIAEIYNCENDSPIESISHGEPLSCPRHEPMESADIPAAFNLGVTICAVL